MGWPFNPLDPFPDIPGIGPILPVPKIPPLPDITPIDGGTPKAPVKPVKDTSGRSFLLSPLNYNDDLVFRGPVRKAIDVGPIVDGEEIFKALEKSIANAQRSVLIAFWTVDPDTKMVSGTGGTWIDLLIAAAKRGAKVRVFLNDFDPGLQSAQHLAAWKAYLRMERAAESVPIDDFQIVCSSHQAETAASVMAFVRPNLYDTIANDLNSIPDAVVRRNLFFLAPGLWDKLDLKPDNTFAQKAKGKSYPALPAVHHQKLVIVDGEIAFVGGLNITTVYIDDRKHDLKSDLPWHDAFVRVEGSQILRDFVRNYAGLWNKERKRAEAFLQAAVNPRSFRVDTELDFRWYSEKIAKELRVNLWNEMLGNPSTLNTWKSKDYVRKWSQIAKKNITGKATDQKGFVIPFDHNKGEKSVVPGLSNLV